MTTPTPLASLQAVMALSEKYHDWYCIDQPNAFGALCQAALAFITDHGAHFAGLESKLSERNAKYSDLVDRYDAAADRINALVDELAQARELLRALLARDAVPYLNGQCGCINKSRKAEIECEAGTCPHQQAAAFLAANGGSK